ncbi:hypothetical protein GCM10009677_44320 [Sphaerisporangium rubeum]|uniref:Uncharacterized protein n=1 Tax=Sphaerisporangium rubeum TaxID=321317 RepID=A0A7X0I9Q5_9ACTN|nr:hypothetical protein [Sphaerisporangium rubeum]MBB6471053.1 hypothetical protein [Sphaerisporangium rubeum]
MLDSDFGRRPILAVDAENYGGGDDLRHDSIQSGLAAVLERSARESGFRRDEWERQEGGDGEVSILPAHVQEPQIIDGFVTRMRWALRDHNRERLPEARLRLRVSINHGVVRRGAMGFVGQAVVTACRLLNSDAARAALRDCQLADLVLILPGRIFEDVVRQGHTFLQADDFTRLEVPTKEGLEIAWVWVPSTDKRVRETLNMDRIPEVADTLWALVSGGALDRSGLETGLESAGLLLARLRDFRTREGSPAMPRTRDELTESLRRMVRLDAAAEKVAQRFMAENMSINVITGSVRGQEITFGFRN